MKTGKIDCCFFIILVFSLYGCKVKESVTDTFTGSYITINESVRDTLIERELPKESVIAEKVLQIRDDADTASIAKNTERNVIPGSSLYNPNFVFGETSFAYAFCFFDEIGRAQV